MRFILVNERVPCPRSFCVMCNQPVGTSYLRELGTELVYCEYGCYTANSESAVLRLGNRAMAS